jgi:predicted enzyme related to lactoylglutathione lyase
VVVKPRTAIGEHGFIAIVKDTEGNGVGLHSMV